MVERKKSLYMRDHSLLEDLPLVPWPTTLNKRRRLMMKMWRLLFLFLICSGVCVAIGLSGCGDNACDDSPCASKQYAVPDSCLVIEEDDYACLCCAPEGDGIPCDTKGIKVPDPEPLKLGDLATKWDEDSKTCVVDD